MCNAGKKIKSIFELFTKQKIGFRFVLFLSVQTLHTTLPVSNLHRCTAFWDTN